MARWLSTLTLNQKLALVAVVLGGVALAAEPYPGGRVTLDARELALAVGREADHVDPPELAAWIVEGRGDCRLIDLRSAEEYAGYHIPGAVNIPLSRLMDAGLGRQEKLLLYSDEGIHSAQAWLLLKAYGYAGVYMLKGGLGQWRDQVLFPVLAASPASGERTGDERRRALSAFFGGQPRSAYAAAGGAAGAVDLPAGVAAAPKVVRPPSAAKGVNAPAGKKKKEGC